MDNKLKLLLNDVSVSAPVIDVRGGGAYNYIKWGERNDFPQYLSDIVADSPTQQAVIKSLHRRMLGAAVNIPTSIPLPNAWDTWAEIIDKCMMDYAVYECFSLQITLAEDGKTFLFYHQPISEVRFAKSEYGKNDIKTAYINSNWRNFKATKIREIKMWMSEKPQKGEKYLAVFKEYSPNELYYHVPSWFSAANWIVADARLSKYYNNFIANNFNGSKHINIPYTPETEDEKKEIYDNLKSNFCGETSAAELFVTFSQGDGEKAEVKTIASPDADLYNNVVRITKENIVTANQLTSPVLAGIATGSGFSSKAEEILAAETAYRLNVVQSKRSFVLKMINKCVHTNGHGQDIITIEDYNLTKEYQGDTKANDMVEDNGVKGNNTQEETEVTPSNNGEEGEI